MRSSVYKALDRLNAMVVEMDRMSDKAWEKSQKGNESSAEYYANKSDSIAERITGFEMCLKILGFDVWADNIGKYHIPLDNIERIC